MSYYKFEQTDFDSRGEWADFVSDLIFRVWGDYEQESQETDDIDRIYRQEEAQALDAILDGIAAGTASWRDLAAFELDFLAEIDGMQEYLDEAVVSSQYAGLYEDIAAANGDSEILGSIFEEYGNAGIETNPYIQQDLASTGSAVSVITGTVDNSILEDMLQKEAIGDGILGGTVDLKDLPGYGGIWEGLIRHIKVIGKGLPLPLPDWLPLPGIFELPTVGEIFDTVTGPWKEAAEDALKNCMDPDGDGVQDKAASVCMEEQSVIDILVDGIGNATEGIWNETAETVQGILDETIDCVSNPATCAQEVFDKIKDIFGEGAVDPTSTGGNIPDWMKVIIIGGAYGDEILGELEDLFGGDIDDDGTVGVGPEDPEECANGAVNYPQCDQCPEGQQLENGQCVDIPPWEDTGPSPQDCANQNRTHVPGDPATQTPSSCGECLTGFEEVDQQCQEEEDPVTNNGPTPQECADQNRAYNPPTDVEDSSCGDCLSGFVETAEGCVEDTGPEECSNGATNFPDCNQCPNGQQLDQVTQQCVDIPVEGCEAVDCSSPRPSPTTFGGQTAYRKWNECCGSTHCPDGSLQQEGFDCEGNPTGPQEGEPCDSTGDGVNDGTIVNGECVATAEEECAKPDGTPTGATVSSGCEQCPDGYTFDFDGICQPDGGSIDCAQYNRETLDDGTCGGCLPGFQKDTSLPNEPCVAIFDGCPAGYELVNGECLAIECPEGQVYCVDTGQCEYPNQCPSTADDGSSSSGGSSGFGIDLELPNLGVGGDPQLLGRQRFGNQDFLSPLFTGRTGQGTDFPIARFLQGQRKKDDFS
jgi:hypothetical protein